jgi:hypothetical protein
MNNVIFGKTMESVIEWADIKLYSDEELIEKQIAKPQFEIAKIYSDILVAIKNKKKEVVLDKPV